jgi:hypothetical protein
VAKGRKAKNWISGVSTVSTYPPQGTFTKSAREIAGIMASPEVSPGGIGSAIRMVQYFINRSGMNLTPARRRELERAKKLLQEMEEREKTG